MSEGRNMVAELEAKMDGKDREIERLKAALREIVSVAVQVDIDAGKRVRSIILAAHKALEGKE